MPYFLLLSDRIMYEIHNIYRKVLVLATIFYGSIRSVWAISTSKVLVVPVDPLIINNHDQLFQKITNTFKTQKQA